ncbi:MAG: efflux RND transporter periplasmic adaptor subunit [Caulobacteraceae bacterium]
MPRPQAQSPSLLAFAAFAALAACSRAPETQTQAVQAEGEELIVRPSQIPDLKPVAAVVTTRDMAEARARVGGTLTSLSVKAGDRVRRGQVIGVVRDERSGLQTRAFDAQASAAQAEAIRARADLARVQDLFYHGVYARARLEQAQAAAKAAEGQLQAAQAQRAASAETSAQGAIVAPSDGQVLRADVPAGSVVAPGQSIATITSGPLVIRIEAPEADAQGLKVGQSVTVDEIAGGKAEVAQVYPDVQGGQARADLGASGLKPDFVGQRLTARLPVGQRQALVIPARFVIARFGVDYVRVKGPQGHFGDAPVQIAPGPEPGQVEVLSGLAQGDVLAAPRSGR